jgi:hypothetical protein
VYRFAAQLPDSAVLIEFPLGEPAFDIRYMFYSTLHWRRLVNGYSGGAPLQYEIADGVAEGSRDATRSRVAGHRRSRQPRTPSSTKRRTRRRRQSG